MDKIEYQDKLYEGRRKSFAGDKIEYTKYLYGDRDWDGKIYIDPDTTHICGEKSVFYSWITEYLNTMEREYFAGTWEYTVVGPSKGNLTPSGIRVRCKNETIMYLRSDQFGFSVPQGRNKKRAWDKRYPYGNYITRTNDCDFAANVIWDTRSYGGCFLWPIMMYESKKKIIWKSQYNTLRGVKSYIEDRVDITLWEIKEFYDNWNQKNGEDLNDFINQAKESGSILLSGSDGDLIIKWLTHFESFEKYIKFFSFESFIIKNTENVIDIITGNAITADYIRNLRNDMRNRIVSIDDEKILKCLLGRLQQQTNCRTDKMLEKVRSTIIVNN